MVTTIDALIRRFGFTQIRTSMFVSCRFNSFRDISTEVTLRRSKSIA